MTATYDLDGFPPAESFLTDLMRVSDVISRLDQRAALSPLLEGWRERLLFEEVVAGQWAEGELIHLDELVQLDAGARYQQGSITLAFALQVLSIFRRGYRDSAARLLSDELPGVSTVTVETPSLASAPTDVYEGLDKEKLLAWRRVMRQSSVHPPLLHAAICWDAWLSLRPEHSGAWRASLIASLVLRSRGLSENFFVPIGLGCKLAKYRWRETQTIVERISSFMHSANAAAVHASKQLVALKHASEVMELHLRGHRKHSRLPGVVALLLSKPIVSIPMIAQHLKMSQRAAAALIGQLGSTPRLITPRHRYRLWRVC